MYLGFNIINMGNSEPTLNKSNSNNKEPDTPEKQYKSPLKHTTGTLLKNSGLFSLLREASNAFIRDTSTIENSIVVKTSKPPDPPAYVKASFIWSSKQNKDEEVFLVGSFNNWGPKQLMKKTENNSPIYTFNMVTN